MNPILSAGLLIGVLVGVWTFVMGLTGWYKDPTMYNAFFLVVVIEIGGLIWGLRRTAAQGRTYSGQVVAGTAMAIVAGVVIICASLLFTTVAFPGYFDDINAMGRGILERAGKSEEEIAAAMNASAAMQTPIRNAFAGFLGTFFTGVIASAIIGVWIRAKPGAPAARV
ncbi:MAG TPA: DUF4199 domain-containing protein [Vicinamibacterales bacterium]|nr:DUF4199 domain-containing protein [Vicinamibacterales bacterium]